MKYDISLSIPHYNEEENVARNIPLIFDTFKKENIGLEIVAVDNGSRDRTLEELKKAGKKYPGLKIIRLEKNAGFGGGINAGLRECTGTITGFTCADTQIKPEDVVKVYRKISKENLDVVKANRVKRFDGAHRFVLTNFFNCLCRTIFRIKIRDINGYPVLMRDAVFKKMQLKKKNWMINIEILVKAKLLKAKFGEVDVVFYKRTKGKSVVKIKTILDFLLQILVFGAQVWSGKEYRLLRKNKVLSAPFQ